MMTYRSKYHNTKVTTADGTFDSMKELHRWSELKLMERAGLISGLARQQRFELIPKQRLNDKTASMSALADKLGITKSSLSRALTKIVDMANKLED